MSKSPAQRAKEYRERKKAKGGHDVRLNLGKHEWQALEILTKARAGCRESYEPGEYLAMLFRKILPHDLALLEKQLAELEDCKGCKQPLPKGCGGCFKGQSDCFHHLDWRVLRL